MTEIVNFKPPADTLRLVADRDIQPVKFTITADPDTGRDDYLAWFFEDPWAGPVCVQVPVEQAQRLIDHLQFTLDSADELRATNREIRERNKARNENEEGHI
jgi:hypothetical protein